MAHVSGPGDWVESSQRRVGWRLAHEQRGLLPGPEIDGDWSPESGYRAGLLIADDRHVSAVFAGNDSMALGLLRALHERGRRVPDDISVVGFDDVPEAAYYWPALTTVTQDFSELGRRALALALAAVRGERDASADLIVPDAPGPGVHGGATHRRALGLSRWLTLWPGTSPAAIRAAARTPAPPGRGIDGPADHDRAPTPGRSMCCTRSAPPVPAG